MSARRKKINPGWLALQRERYGPEYRYIPPDQVRRAGDLVPKVLKGLGMESQSRLAEMSKAWPELAGRANAQHSRPGTWENGVLTVYVDHHVWLAELQRFAGKALEKRLKDAFGADAVRRVRFEIDPGEEDGE